MPIDPAILAQVRNNELTRLDLNFQRLTDSDMQQFVEAIPSPSAFSKAA